VFDPYLYEAIDWDDEDDEDGNLQHCLRHGVDEAVVGEVLATHPVEVKFPLISAEIALTGPNASYTIWWTLLLATSYKRGDWLRPVTGWRAKVAEVRSWENATGQTWSGERV